MAPIREFTIQVPNQKIEQLKQKLELTDLPDELEDVDWQYGTPLGDVTRFLQYWRTQYNWEKTKYKLNLLPNYITNIEVDGFDPVELHFLHQRSNVQNAIPLIFVHGWPGSVIEVTRLLPYLSDGGMHVPAFHVVAPSLPNFGFSGAIRKSGFRLKQYAETCHKLMCTLGYEEYVTQGGDWVCQSWRFLPSVGRPLTFT
jgi:pimeloyl-ACP methyl ester carboxylesterase